MRNLANSSREQNNIDYTNYHVERELRHARLNPETIEIYGEVPTTIGATLGDLTFRRYWTYWVVEGNVPKHVARMIYADPIGQDDVRAYGHCGCVDPDKYAPNDQYVGSYHIDSVAGLRLFVDIISNEL